MYSHDPFFRNNKESSIWRQNNHAKSVSAFHLSRRLSDENGACSISTRFFKITDPFDGRSFLMCSHDPFFGTNKNQILENVSCERALRWQHESGTNSMCLYYTNYGETDAEFYFHTLLKKYKRMLEFYQLRNIKRQTLQSAKTSHEIVHMLGYHVSCLHTDII